MKIGIHITYFHIPERIKYLERCIYFLNRLGVELDVFVHTNNKELKLKNKNNVSIIVHDISKEHPHFLSWKHRPMMKDHRKEYDYMMYMEDDILFNRNNLKYYLKYHDICKSEGYYLGFLRKEFDGKEWFLTDIHKDWGDFPLTKKVRIGSYEFFLHSNNTYHAFWIMDKEEINDYCNHEYYDLSKSPHHYGFIREQSAWGFYPYLKGVLIPGMTKGAFVHHMPNNYIGSGWLCTQPVNKLFG